MTKCRYPYFAHRNFQCGKNAANVGILGNETMYSHIGDDIIFIRTKLVDYFWSTAILITPKNAFI